MEIGWRILKDGYPGTVTGWGDGEDAVDLILDNGRETYIRNPGQNSRLYVLGPGMSDTEKRLARHALGLPHPGGRSYRNWYIAALGSDVLDQWRSMVQRHYAVEHRVGCFRLTLAGAQAALEPGESLDTEDFPEAGP